MSIDPRVDRLAAQLARVERELSAMKTPQLANSTIVDGALFAYDDATETDTMQIGLQYDGTNASVPLTGPTPPTPTAPAVIVGLDGATFAWNGQFTDAQVASMDHARVDVVIESTDAVTPASPVAGSIMTARGGSVFVGLPPGNYWAALVTRAQTGKPSAVSAVVAFEVAEPALGSDGVPPPPLEVAPQVTGGAGSLFVSHPGVVNSDGRPVKYAIHVEPITEQATDFVATPANRVGYMDGTFAQVTTLADGTPLPYGNGYTSTLPIFELSLLASGRIGIFVAGQYDYSPRVGDVVTIAGTGLAGVDGPWPVSAPFSTSIFELQGTHTETPATGISLPNDTATLTIPDAQRYGVKIWPEDEDGPTATPSPMGAGVVRRVGGVDLEVNSITADKLVINSQLVGEIMAQAIQATLVRSATSGARWEGDSYGLRIFGPDGELKINLPTFSENPDDPLTATFKGQGWFESLGVANFASFDGQDNSFNKGSKFWLLSGTTRPSSAPAAIPGWAQKTTHLGYNPVGFFPMDSETYVHCESLGTAGLTRAVWSNSQKRYVAASNTEIRAAGAAAADTARGVGSPVRTLSGKWFQMVISRTPMGGYRNYWQIRRLNWNGERFVQEASLNFQPGGASSVHGANSDHDGTLFYNHEDDRLMFLEVNGNGDTNVFEINQSTLVATMAFGGSVAALRLGTTGAGTTGAYWKPGRAVVGAVMMGNGVSQVDEAAVRNTTIYSKSGSNITVTTSQPHGFSTGMRVRLSLAPFDGAYTVASVPSPTTFVISSSAGVAGAQPYVATVRPTRMLWTVRDSGGIVDAWAWNVSSGDFVNSPMDSFPIPTASTNGFVWDPASLGGTGGFRTRQGASVLDHTRVVWTGDSSTWWFTHTLYDPNVAGNGVQETEMASPRQVTMLKRACLTVTPPPVPARPIPNTPDDPTHIRLYTSRNQYGSPAHTPARTEFELIATLAGTTVPFQTIIDTTPAFSVAPANTPPSFNSFSNVAPAEFLSTKLVPTTSYGAGPMIQSPAMLKGDGDSWLAPPHAPVKMWGIQVDGWLICNGQVVLASDYPVLFARYGTTFNIGGEPAGSFRLPTKIGEDRNWTAVANANGWVSSAKVKIFDGGEVKMQGTIVKAAGSGSGGQNTLVVPARFRPAEQYVHTTYPFVSAVNYLAIQTSGMLVVNFIASISSPVWLSPLVWQLETWTECDWNYFVRAA